MNKMEKRGQVWIETVVYTLIGLVIIGSLLAISKPKIDEIKDQMVIKQTIDAMKTLNQQIEETSQTAGIKRVPEIRFQKGELIISPSENIIYWKYENSHSQYSEPGVLIQDGELKILTEKDKTISIKIYLNYSERFNIKYDGGNEEKTLQNANLPYSFAIENMGAVSGIPQIDISAS